MWVQTEREFNHNDIKRLNNKYEVSSNKRDGKAFAAEQKIREFQKLWFKAKHLGKRTKENSTQSTNCKSYKQLK